jgi:hypothetical protein
LKVENHAGTAMGTSGGANRLSNIGAVPLVDPNSGDTAIHTASATPSMPIQLEEPVTKRSVAMPISN